LFLPALDQIHKPIVVARHHRDHLVLALAGKRIEFVQEQAERDLVLDDVVDLGADGAGAGVGVRGPQEHLVRGPARHVGGVDAAIDAAGGWEHDTLTEDTDLSYRAQLKGWKFLYLPNIECASELPVDMNGFKAQQARWAKGLMQTAKKILPQVFRSNAPWHVKAEAFFHLTANVSYPLMVLFSAMLLPAMIVRFYQGWFQMLLIDLPLFLASTCSISSFYLVAQKELRPKTWYRTFFYMPFVMATGIGISIRNAKAVLEAIFGVKSEFARTPKFKIEGKKDTFVTKTYRNKAGWMPYAEIFLGIYFACTVVYAVTNQNFATIPFLLLFVWGYLYTGFMSLGQTYFAHLRFGVNAPEMRPASSGAPGF